MIAPLADLRAFRAQIASEAGRNYLAHLWLASQNERGPRIVSPKLAQIIAAQYHYTDENLCEFLWSLIHLVDLKAPVYADPELVKAWIRAQGPNLDLRDPEILDALTCHGQTLELLCIASRAVYIARGVAGYKHEVLASMELPNLLSSVLCPCTPSRQYSVDAEALADFLAS